MGYLAEYERLRQVGPTMPFEARAKASELIDDLARRTVLEIGPTDPDFGVAFMRYYLTDYCRVPGGGFIPPADWHEQLFHEVFLTMGEGVWHAHLAPRGYAKTTIIGMALPIAALGLSGLALAGKLPYYLNPRHYVWIIQDESKQAKQSMENLIDAIESSDRIRRDFPHLRPQLDTHNRPVADRDDDVVFEMGLRLQALGAGQKLRGRRHRQHRPDLVLIDDLENDESVLTRYQRDKLDSWVNSALAFAVAKGGDVHMMGTLLHNDAVLARQLKKKGGWRAHRYEAFDNTRWVKCPDHGWRVDPDAPLHPDFDCDLCHGTGKVRPVRWGYRDHKWHATMLARVGRLAYSREVLHVVTDEDRKRFPASYFQWGDTPQGDDVRVRIAVDPAIGEKKENDRSAIVTVMKRRGDRMFHVDAAWAARMRGSKVRTRIVDTYQHYKQLGYSPIVVFESVQAQAWGKEELEDIGIPIAAIRPSDIGGGDKYVRAEGASLHYEMGRVTHNPKLRDGEFEAELDEFPDGEHDDYVDAVVYGISSLEVEKGGGVAGVVTSAPSKPKAQAPYDPRVA